MVAVFTGPILSVSLPEIRLPTVMAIVEVDINILYSKAEYPNYARNSGMYQFSPLVVNISIPKANIMSARNLLRTVGEDCLM